MAQKPGQKDNSTLRLKAALRRSLLAQIDQPFVLETHGGFGHIYRQVYHNVPVGVVFEKDPEKTAVLAKQRPTWAVYEADCEIAITDGAVDDWPFNFVDLDPYGEPWPVLDAFLQSDRPRVDSLWIVVNDGLRQKLAIGAWDVGSMQSIVERFGNDLHGRYLDVCRLLVKEKADQAGYRLAAFAGYYCGHGKQMTHYLARLDR